MIRILVVFGTRPEAIKMAPVVHRLREDAAFDVRTVVTGQHREMLDQVLHLFRLEPDADLDVMLPRQSLDHITRTVVGRLGPVLDETRPDAVLVQGDTTTTFAAALAAFYRQIPVGHVEAGLRTGDVYRPFPEEMNRRLTTSLATWHFSPTETARAQLVREGVDEDRIWVTGNTVIDALFEALDIPFAFAPGPLSDVVARGSRLVLLTCHRRENWGEPMRAVCGAVRRIAETHRDVDVVFSVHRNPEVRELAEELLGDAAGTTLIEPLDYLPFVNLMKASTLILSDSGGVQEEAPSLGKPVLVLRESTERPEAVASGCVRLVGTDEARIRAEVSRLLDDETEYRRMSRASNPYGDGHAAERIRDALLGELAAPFERRSAP